MRKLTLALALALLGFATAAHAASTNFSIVFSEAPSTSVSCTAGGPFSVPVAAGTQVATCTVAPATWTGSLALSGSDAASFTVAGTAPNFTVSVGSSAFTTVGTVSLTATSTP